MTVKELAREVIDALPDDATMEDVMHALFIRAKFEGGERAIRDGRGVEHAEVRERLKKWAG